MNTLEILQDLLIKRYSLAREDLAPDIELAAVGIDSLGLIELMFDIEERLGITLPDTGLPTLVTIGDAVSYIDRLKTSPAPPSPTFPAG